MKPIRKDTALYMKELKSWLKSQRDVPLEKMEDFFAARMEIYDRHMCVWADAYRALPGYLPQGTQKILDLGAGTGLEIGEIYKRFPQAEVVAVDLSETMLRELTCKYIGKPIEKICADYFETELGGGYDAAISVESLHHFSAEQKLPLYRKICEALKPNGIFLLCDYIACCDEEEKWLAEECARKRKEEKIPENTFVHFDTPLTLPHETALLKEAGFRFADGKDCIEGATIIVAEKAGGITKKWIMR